MERGEGHHHANKGVEENGVSFPGKETITSGDGGGNDFRKKTASSTGSRKLKRGDPTILFLETVNLEKKGDDPHAPRKGGIKPLKQGGKKDAALQPKVWK